MDKIPSTPKHIIKMYTLLHPLSPTLYLDTSIRTQFSCKNKQTVDSQTLQWALTLFEVCKRISWWNNQILNFPPGLWCVNWILKVEEQHDLEWQRYDQMHQDNTSGCAVRAKPVLVKKKRKQRKVNSTLPQAKCHLSYEVHVHVSQFSCFSLKCSLESNAQYTKLKPTTKQVVYFCLVLNQDKKMLLWEVLIEIDLEFLIIWGVYIPELNLRCIDLSILG